MLAGTCSGILSKQKYRRLSHCRGSNFEFEDRSHLIVAHKHQSRNYSYVKTISRPLSPFLYLRRWYWGAPCQCCQSWRRQDQNTPNGLVCNTITQTPLVSSERLARQTQNRKTELRSDHYKKHSETIHHESQMSGLDSSPGATGEESLSPLEQEVLDEYVRLAGNLGDVSVLFIAPCFG